MAFEFKFPDVGEGITEGEIVKWLVKEGDSVKQDQIIAKIETDKAIVDIPSPKAGVILKLGHKEGDTIKVGEVLAVIGEKGETLEETRPAKKLESERKSVSVVGEIPESLEYQPVTRPVQRELQATPTEHSMVLPSVRRLSRELGVDLSTVKGTGIGGRITEEDVRRAKGTGLLEKVGITKPVAVPQVIKKYDMYGYIEHVQLKGIRKATAKKMSQAVHTAAHVTHMDNADVTELAAIREKEKLNAEKEGIKLTYLPYIIKAVIGALKKHPYLNAEMDEEHEEIILKKYYNIGIAVDIEGGLIVPVIKGADKKSTLDLAKELQEVVKKAEERSLDMADLKGGTFTITNVGSLGGIYATPIVNYPEVAILATGKIADRPVVKDGKIVVRKILPLALSFDHRVLDGAEAARFTNDLIALLENPEKIPTEAE